MTVKINRKFVDHILLERGISARELAQLADVGEATMYRILNGAAFSSVTLGKIAEALECNPVDLLDAGGFASPLVEASPVETSLG